MSIPLEAWANRWAKWPIEIAMTDVLAAMDMDCTTPIEKAFLGAFSFADFWYLDGTADFNPRPKLSRFTKKDELSSLREYVLIAPQVPLLGYRVDFLVTAKLPTKPVEIRIVVECDGHDFHERTKKQAAHDRRRDRVFTAAGYKVFRFTGSELWKDAPACAQEIADYLGAEATT